MKALVAYYSRTGTTKKVAERISTLLEGDVEEIHDLKKRSGVIGWLRAGRDASSKKLTTLEKVKNDPAMYDIVVIGTPIWSRTVSTPIRTYISQYKENFKKVAFFSVEGGTGGNPFDEMRSLCGKEPKATLRLRRRRVKSDDYAGLAEEFVDKIKT